MTSELRKLGQCAVKIHAGMETTQASIRKAMNSLPRVVKQSHMARDLGVSTATVSSFLSGKKDFSVETMKKVAAWGRKEGE